LPIGIPGSLANRLSLKPIKRMRSWSSLVKFQMDPARPRYLCFEDPKGFAMEIFSSEKEAL